jgi:hypothetical protein
VEIGLFYAKKSFVEDYQIANLPLLFRFRVCFKNDKSDSKRNMLADGSDVRRWSRLDKDSKSYSESKIVER